MPRSHDYVQTLSALDDDDAALTYLTENSHLPGPRSNLELLDAFAGWASPALAGRARESADEFLRSCGVAAMGHEIATRTAETDLLAELREHARDRSWRVREAAAMALQAIGDSSRPELRRIVAGWVTSSDPLVLRAAVAGICEPRLLDAETAAAALVACQAATDALAAVPAEDRRDEHVRVLRKALGYCWSVAVAAGPADGLRAFRVLESQSGGDVDLAWIVRENSRKARFIKALAAEAPAALQTAP